MYLESRVHYTPIVFAIWTLSGWLICFVTAWATGEQKKYFFLNFLQKYFDDIYIIFLSENFSKKITFLKRSSAVFLVGSFSNSSISYIFGLEKYGKIYYVFYKMGRLKSQDSEIFEKYVKRIRRRPKFWVPRN